MFQCSSMLRQVSELQSFLWLNNSLWHLETTPFICWLTLVWLLWTMLVWTGVPVFVCVPVFSSFWHTPRCRIVRPYGDSIFNILRNHQHFFHSSCTVLHPHHHNMPAFIVYTPPACTQVTSRQTDISHQPETNTTKRNRAGQRIRVDGAKGGQGACLRKWSLSQNLHEVMEWTGRQEVFQMEGTAQAKSPQQERVRCVWGAARSRGGCWAVSGHEVGGRQREGPAGEECGVYSKWDENYWSILNKSIV